MSEDYKYTPRDLAEADKKLKNELLKESNIPVDLLQYSWIDYKTYDIEDFSEIKGKRKEDRDRRKKRLIESREKALNECAMYSKNLPDVYRSGHPLSSLFIYGGRGSGKSVLGSLILRTAIDKLLQEVFYIPFAVLVNEMKYYHNGKREEERLNKIYQYSEYKFLMIDEIDYGYNLTGYTLDGIVDILTKRMMNNLPTIITSKVPYDNLTRVLNIPISRIIGKEEVYHKIHIENTAILRANEILSKENSFDVQKWAKIDRMIRYEIFSRKAFISGDILLEVMQLVFDENFDNSKKNTYIKNIQKEFGKIKKQNEKIEEEEIENEEDVEDMDVFKNQEDRI